VSTAELGTHGIVTPEGVVLEFEPARLGMRSLQMGLDFVIQMGVLLVVLGILAAVVGQADSFGAAVIILITVISFVVVLGYPILMETLCNGRTVGMMAAGLRVVTVEGAPIRFRHATIRGFLLLVDFWLCTGIIGAVTMLCNRNSQRLGDLAAGTLVLRERTAARTDSPVAFLPPPGWEPYAASLDPGRMTEEQYGLVRGYLLRVGELSPAARAEVAVRLADPIARSMHHAPPPHVTPEAFLVCVAASYQRLHAGGEPAWGPEGPLGPYRPMGVPGGSWGGPPPGGPGSLGGVPTAAPAPPVGEPAWQGPEEGVQFPSPEPRSFARS
jgi:uncharacterized RDD family membrane protein YckC